MTSINKLRGLSAAAVGDDEETDKDIEDGGANIVFGSAEQSGSAINGRKLCSLEVCTTPKSYLWTECTR